MRRQNAILLNLKLSFTVLFSDVFSYVNLTSKTTNAFCLSGEKRLSHTVQELKTKAKREKSYIPLLLPVDSNLSFKMAHTKNQRRLAN